MKKRSLLIDVLFFSFIVCLAVFVSVWGKWSAFKVVSDRQADTYTVKHTGYYDERVITSADGPTEIPIDRLDRNPYSTSMMGDTKGVSVTSSTMIMP